MIGAHLYPPTWLHRVPAGLKLLLLLVASTFFLTQGAWWVFAISLPAVLGLYANLSYAALRRLRGMAPLLPFIVIIYAAQWAFAGHGEAFVSVARLCLMVLLADLVTMTTTTHAMLDALTPLFRPLERLGVRSARLALAIALVVRFVPVMFDLWNRRREAWSARTGRRPSVLLVRLFLADMLRLADNVSEALDARGHARKDDRPFPGRQGSNSE